MNIPKTSFPRIVIVGGGFAGISIAKGLKNKEVQVVLLDKHNYHTFQPLLYQVSTGGLEPDSIAYPIRKVLKDYNNFFFRLAHVEEIRTEENTIVTNIGTLDYDYLVIFFRLAHVEEIRTEENTIVTNIGTLDYDYLVIATGSETNYYGNREIELNSMAMKTIPQSLNLRSLILENFEQALLTDQYHERDALMNFVIVGAGPTGVELAGALAEIKKGILPKDYPDLDTRRVQIHLIQSGDRILKEMSEKASQKAEDFLEGLGVQIWKNSRVTGYDGKTVTTNTDVDFETATLVWAAGVKGVEIKGLNAKDLLVAGSRIPVDEYNRVKGYNNIFAVGDVACMQTKDAPKGHPMMAQPAMQQGRNLGENLVRLLEDRPLEPFVYRDKGSMATIGRNKAVVDMKNIRFQGVFAWFVWMFVHLFFLIGFRNRMVVFVNWVYNYVRFDREARLIIRPFNRNYSAFKD